MFIKQLLGIFQSLGSDGTGYIPTFEIITIYLITNCSLACLQYSTDFPYELYQKNIYTNVFFYCSKY